MNQKKRKTVGDEVFIAKKHVDSIACFASTITQFEQMSNEIFYEIFDYLDGYDIFHAFFHLNERFQILFSYLTLKISFKDKKLKQIMDIHDTMLVPFSARIRSIEMDALIFHVSMKPYILFLKFLQTLSHPFSFRLHVNNYRHEYFPNIHKQILSIPYLESFELIVSSTRKLNFELPLSTKSQFNLLKSLTYSHQIYLNELISVLYCTPQLQCLSCGHLIDSNTNEKIDTIISNLQKLKIKQCQVEFDNFERFLCAISSRLEFIQIDDYCTSTSILPERWKQLLSQHFHSLNFIRIKCNLKTIENFDIDSIKWFTNVRNYRFRFEIQSTEIFYIISSFIPSNDLFRSAVELSINNHPARPLQAEILNKFHVIFRNIPFTSLHLFANDMSIDNFMTLFSFLPNLQTLKLLSTLYFQDEIIEFLSHTNQISHVSTSMNFQHIQLLTQICTRMQYMEIIGVNKKNFLKLIEFLFDKISTDLTNLRHIRFYVYDDNVSVSNTLKSFLQTQTTFQNFRLRSSGGFLSLEW